MHEEEIIEKSHLNRSQENFEIKYINYIYYTWLLLLSSSLWYCDHIERKIRINKILEVLNKLDSSDRNKEIEDAFAVDKEKHYESVCLIDDIYTTGSTIESMAKILKENGVKKVYFACLSVLDNI